MFACLPCVRDKTMGIHPSSNNIIHSSEGGIKVMVVLLKGKKVAVYFFYP